MGKVVENEKAINLLKNLCEIESPSKKETAIKCFVKDYLLHLGYEVVESDYFLFVKNDSDLIVATHLDTVPVKRKFSTDGNFAYGTGVCDAKGSLTAILLAAESRVAWNMAFFCDEEEDGLGSREFLSVKTSANKVIVMEPTELKIASRHWGSFELILKVIGEEAHGAFPEVGKNAIELVFEIFHELKKLDLKINTLKIMGGGEEYIIPKECEVKFEVFLKPEEKLKEVVKKLDFLKHYGKVEVDHAYEGYQSQGVEKVLEPALSSVGITPEWTEMKSWTDALNLKERFDVVVWGPGSLPMCHTAEEKIRISEILEAAKVLRNL